MSLAYPKSLPKPTRRKGGLTYEIRVRVPQEARGEKFKASHTTRALGTRDKAEALRNLPKIYDDLQAEFEAEAARQSIKHESPNVRLLSVDEVCEIERNRLLKSEQQNRRERLSGFVGDPEKLAQEHRTRLQNWLKRARARAINRSPRFPFISLETAVQRAKQLIPPQPGKEISFSSAKPRPLGI